MTKYFFLVCFFFIYSYAFSFELDITLKDDEDMFIKSASVTLGNWQFDTKKTPTVIITDQNGHALFSSVPSGVYSLQINKPGFQDKSIAISIYKNTSKIITLNKAPADNTNNIPFFDHCSFRGRIFNKDNRTPLSNVDISLGPMRTISDKNGRFVLKDIKTTPMTVHIFLSDFFPLTEEVQLSDGKNFHDFYLKKIQIRSVISGMIKNKKNGMPVKSNILIDGKAYTTDASGKYSIELPSSSKDHKFEINSNGFHVYTQNISIKKPAVHLDVLLDPEATPVILSGIIRNFDSGAPVSDAKVLIGGKIAYTDKDGHYQISNLAPGEYSLQIICAQKSIYSQKIMIYPGKQSGDILVNPE